MEHRSIALLRDVADRAGLQKVPTNVLVALVCVAAIAVGWATVRWWPSHDRAFVDATHPAGGVQPADHAAPPAHGGEVAASPSGDAPPTSDIYVHVEGAVRTPGVYVLTAGSRVVDAIQMAGGLTGGAQSAAVNMARVVSDGEQIYVPTKDEVESGTVLGPAAATAGGTAAVPQGTQGAGVDLNSADATALQTLPGVGPSTAAKIVADREANGPFKTVDDLTRVSGIGPKKLEGLRDMAYVR